MKRSWGVLALVMPVPNDSEPVQHPIEKGDGLPPKLLKTLTVDAFPTVPATLLRGRPLIVRGVASWGHTIAHFPLPNDYRYPSARLHLAALFPARPDHVCALLGTEAHLLHLPVAVGTHGYAQLRSATARPTALVINQRGWVEAIFRGEYMDRHNVRRLTGSKPLYSPLIPA